MAGGFDECEDEDGDDDAEDINAGADGDGNMMVDLENALEGEVMEQQISTGVEKMEMRRSVRHTMPIFGEDILISINFSPHGSSATTLETTEEISRSSKEDVKVLQSCLADGRQTR
ncbi:hypothetical protein PG990_007674 [Apiospora arundinis]